MRSVLTLALCWLLAGAAEAQAPARTVSVYAASSLKDALDEVDAAWSKTGGGSAVVSYAASSVLARQIEQGAPAEVFISADSDWMDYLPVGDRSNPLSGVCSSEQEPARASTVYTTPSTCMERFGICCLLPFLFRISPRQAFQAL